MNEALERAVKIIIEVADPDSIILFGSRSRGDEGKQSDFDVCVLKKGFVQKRKLAQRIYRSLYGIGTPVDIIVETPDKLEELKKNPYMIYKEIAEQGKIIYEKSATG